jgi:predicted HicB family RNase H-like nuclease
MQRYDGFEVKLFYDEHDDWGAAIVEIQGLSAFGETPEKALEELDMVWQMYKDSLADAGEPLPEPDAKYSGQLSVRIDKRVHKALIAEAHLAGISLNALVAQKLYYTTMRPERRV